MTGKKQALRTAPAGSTCFLGSDHGTRGTYGTSNKGRGRVEEREIELETNDDSVLGQATWVPCTLPFLQ